MKDNYKLYQATFSHLHASGGSIKETKRMKAKQIRHMLVIGTAAAALMATAAGATNLATEGQFFENIRMFVSGNYQRNSDGSCTFSGVDKDGNEVQISVKETDEPVTVTYYTEEGEAYTTGTLDAKDVNLETEGNSAQEYQDYAVTITGDEEKLADLPEAAAPAQ